MSKKLKHHALADLLPPMTEEEYQALKQQIQEWGQIDPVVLLDGKILDGRHRNRACEELGIAVKTIDYKKSWGDPVQFVIAKASHRNMSAGQKAVAAEAFIDQLPATDNGGRSSHRVASLFGVNFKYVDRVRQIRTTDKGIYDQIRSGELNINQAFNRLKHAVRSKAVRKVRESASDAVVGAFDIREGDVLKQLAKMEDGSIDMIFTDPPYNIGVKYDGDKTGDQLSGGDFIVWCETWIAELARVLKPSGSIFIMMSNEYAGGVEMAMRQAGLFWRNTIVWHETFGSYTESNLTDCWRAIHYFTKSELNLTWNTDVREESARQKIGDARANPHGKVPSNVWQISRVQGNNGERVPFADAPPQLPVEIPERCILLASNMGDTVLDCFNGNGTTAIAAIKHGRNYIGIERSPKYRKQSIQWIKSQVKGAK